MDIFDRVVKRGGLRWGGSGTKQNFIKAVALLSRADAFLGQNKK
jgi:hypothetical protein